MSFAEGTSGGSDGNWAKVLRPSSRQQSKPQKPQDELENDSARNGQEEAKQEGVDILGRVVQVEEHGTNSNPEKAPADFPAKPILDRSERKDHWSGNVLL
jgi:hypothetical protein